MKGAIDKSGCVEPNLLGPLTLLKAKR